MKFSIYLNRRVFVTTCFLIAARQEQEVDKFESSFVGHALEFALYGLLWNFVNQYNVGSLSWFSLILSGRLKTMIVYNRHLIFGSLRECFSTAILFFKVCIEQMSHNDSTVCNLVS